MRKIPYPHPGEILMEEFLNPMGITQYRVAKEIGVPQRRIGEIVAGTRGVTADTGLRLSRFFNVSEGFWIGLQMDYDAAIAKDLIEKTLAKIKPWKMGKVSAVGVQPSVPADVVSARPLRRVKAPAVRQRRG
jgi:addiction module HigA family antidote